MRSAAHPRDVVAERRSKNGQEELSEAEESRVWYERAIPFAVASAPVAAAIAHLRASSDATHDEAAIRVIGAGSTGIWREFDALVGGVALLFPGWTSVARAEIAAAVGCGLGAFLLYTVARRMLGQCAPTTWLGILVATIAAWTATLGAGWQTEACAIGGATWGALLPFVPLAILLRKRVHPTLFPLAALACGLALSYEPLVGAAAVSATLAVVLLGNILPTRGDALRSAPAFVVGVVGPIVFALWRRAVSPFALSAPSVASGWLGTLDLRQRGSLAVFAHAEVGWVALAATAAGFALAWLVPRARAMAAALALLIAFGAFAIFAGAAVGPDRYAAAPLMAIAAASILAAIAMQAAVRAVARANVPFAQASASMIVVLELTFPAVAFDDASLRAIERKNKLGSHWDEEALADLPEQAIVLVSDPRVMRHLSASVAIGSMRGDLVFLTLQDIGSRGTLRALAAEPKLAPVVRDVALTGAATEFSLASLAATRPLFVQYDPKWDKSLTRHLVPGGVLDRFEPEPHGVTDRRKALDAFLPLRQKLARDVALPRDSEMTAVTASLMHSRLDALVAIDEHETLPRAIDDLRAFAPDDPIANRLVFKLVASRLSGRN